MRNVKELSQGHWSKSQRRDHTHILSWMLTQVSMKTYFVRSPVINSRKRMAFMEKNPRYIIPGSVKTRPDVRLPTTVSQPLQKERFYTITEEGHKYLRISLLGISDVFIF